VKLLDRLRYGHLTRDRCEVCGAALRERQRVELTDAGDPIPSELGDAFGSISATYCKRDAPT